MRDSSSVMQASKQLQFFGAPPSDMSKSNPLYRLERALGVTQHHDSVSGTSKQHVAYDYARRLAWGREDAAAGNKLALQALTRFKGDFVTCDLANATICPALETPVAGQSVLVLVWNQQAQNAPATPVRLPAMLTPGVASFSVQGPDGADLVAQLVPASGADLSLRVGYYGAAAASSIVWVCFQAPVPALGFAAFFLTAKAAAAEAPLTHVSVPRKMATGAKALRASAKDETLTNGIVTLTISAATGMLSQYADSAEKVSLPLAQSFFFYNSSSGNDAPNDGTSDYNQASGAYIFRTNSSTNFPVASGAATVELVSGPVVNEARMVCADGSWITNVVRLWAGAHSADVEMTVGPIPNGPSPRGKEVVTRYASDLATNKSWATDSNVRDMMPRVRDFRATWPYQVYEPIAGNYVPVNSRIITSDAATGVTLSVTTDRTQGGSSMVDGSLELMVHRRLQQDDRRGVGEPINEPGLDASGAGLIIRAVHRISVLPAASAAARGKQE